MDGLVTLLLEINPIASTHIKLLLTEILWIVVIMKKDRVKTSSYYILLLSYPLQ